MSLPTMEFAPRKEGEEAPPSKRIIKDTPLPTTRHYHVRWQEQLRKFNLTNFKDRPSAPDQQVGESHRPLHSMPSKIRFRSACSHRRDGTTPGTATAARCCASANFCRLPAGARLLSETIRVCTHVAYYLPKAFTFSLFQRMLLTKFSSPISTQSWPT